MILKCYNMPVKCEQCSKLFSKRSSLNRHIREVHKMKPKVASYDTSVWKCKCLEDDCNKSFQQNKALITHLTEEHSKTFDYIELSLRDMDEFQSWKTSIEKETKCSYIFKSKVNSAVGFTMYYNCNRSFTGKGPRDKNKQYQRLLKSKGSCKMSSCCTSQIKLIKKGGNDILIQWQKTHYGHTLDLKHVRLSVQDREEVALKLISGVTSEKILEKTQDGLEKELKRLDLLTRKDICNIKGSFNIKDSDVESHVNDAIFVDLSVKECSTNNLEDNPELVLYIFERHVEALTLNYNIETYEKYWKIFKESGDFYTVIKLSDTKCCEEYCSACNICKHMYSCSCQDFEETFIICKHIHYIHYNTFNNIAKNVDNYNRRVTSTSQSNESDTDNLKLNSMINLVCYKLQQCEFETLNDEVIRQIAYHLKILNKLIILPKYNEKQILQNNNIEPQLRFSSTKRKRENIKRKNSYERSNKNTINNVLNNQTNLCISTSPIYDHMYYE
uniref:C2H2-type domain-containing protein n=2 Tax=Photinus pyralis TaxID=7054 RepID=A0A1Y1M411_PHOPY